MHSRIAHAAGTQLHYGLLVFFCLQPTKPVATGISYISHWSKLSIEELMLKYEFSSEPVRNGNDLQIIC